MKKIFSFALMACALLLNTACSDENVESRTPVASIQYDTNKTTLKVNESLVIDFTGVADLVAIYTGDDGHRYEKRDEMETGIAVNKNHFTYSYKAPGTYHVVCVASTFDTYMGGNLKLWLTMRPNLRTSTQQSLPTPSMLTSWEMMHGC